MLSLEIKVPQTHLAAKRKELEFLARNSKTDFSFARAKKWTYSDLFQFYFKVRENGHAIPRGYLGESSVPGIDTPVIGGFEFDYGYQRVRLNCKNSNPLRLIHPFSGLNFPGQSIFLVSSVQGGFTQLFEAVHRCLGRMPVWAPHGCYHETKRFLKVFGWKLTANDPEKPSILFFDSSTLRVGNRWNELNPNAGVKLIVFDTTCFSRNSSQLKSILKSLKKFNCPVVLVRSALKLDNLGMEWGRFGHLLFLNGQKSAEFRDLCGTYDQLTSSFGTSASTRQIYPFYSDRTFQVLNEGWVKRIRKSNEIAVAALKRNPKVKPSDVVEFQHQNFFWLKMPKSLEMSHKEEERICQKLLFYKIPYVVAPNFPWSSLALSSFYNRRKFILNEAPRGTEERFLRVSFGDFDEATAQIYADAFSRILTSGRT